MSQITGRCIFFPEMLRNALFVVGTLLLSARDGSITPLLVLLVVAEGTCTHA